jgi:hypothetical protein
LGVKLNRIGNIIRRKFRALKLDLDERSRRRWAASEALAIGHGGVALVSKATGLAASTIRIGKRELSAKVAIANEGRSSRRVRKLGGGRKPLTVVDQTLLSALDGLVEPLSRGDPMSPLRWTCKSTRKLAAELTRQGHRVSHTKVGQLLLSLNYSLQSTRKTREGGSHPDRNAQFEYIYKQVRAFQERGQPVISVDAKKKECVGDFANRGREYQPKGRPEPVRVYDFVDKELGKVTPYGVLDLTTKQGWVSVGTDHDTAQFAVETIRRWWRRMGVQQYPTATDLLITADGGGSNGTRVRLWKLELQKLARETRLNITVCHFPPGTSKWNKIEHDMFCHITENWRGKPLVSHEVIVNLIAHTTTQTGLKIESELDEGKYPLGLEVTDAEMHKLNIPLAKFHGADWNYTISP